MIQIGQKRGTGLQSSIIEDVTNSQWSHTLVRFECHFCGLDSNGDAVTIPKDGIVEAWQPRVRKLDRLSDGHEKGTAIDFFSLRQPLNEVEFETFARFMCRQIGKRYDLSDACAFLPGARHFGNPPSPGLTYWQYDRWFCSAVVSAGLELVGRKLFNFRPVWRIEPALVPESLLIDPSFKTEFV